MKNIFGNSLSTAPEGKQASGNIGVSPNQLREVAPEAYARLQKVHGAVERVNASALNMDKSFPIKQTVANMVANTAIAPAQPTQTFAPIEAAPQPELLDDRLAYAADTDIIDEAEAIARHAAEARQDVVEAHKHPAFEPAPMPRSPFDERTEVGIAGPQVDPTVTYMANLQSEMSAQSLPVNEVALDQTSVRQQVEDAYSKPYDDYTMAA